MDPLLTRIHGGEVPPFDAVVDAWSGVLPWLARLASTPQDPVWHGEGDVHVHTSMVLEQVAEQLSSGDFSGTARGRTALILGAALHDVGKAVTTRTARIEGHDRVVAPRHADRGRSRAIGELIGLGLEPALALDVAALIGGHHEPRKLVADNRSDAAFRGFAGLVATDIVFALEDADLRGRVCPDLDDQLETLALFRAGAEVAGAWGVRDPLHVWRAAVAESLGNVAPAIHDAVLAQVLADARLGLAHTVDEAMARSWARREPRPWLTLVVGPSGSGKSMAIRALDEAPRVVSMDVIREAVTGRRADQSRNGQVFQQALEALRAAFRAGADVVWDATSLRRSRRAQLLRLASDYGACARIIAFVGPRAELVGRNASREHPVPAAVLDKQIAGYEVPWGDEADVVEWSTLDGTRFARFVGGFAEVDAP